jgi:Tfp pilus assembly protein FimT
MKHKFIAGFSLMETVVYIGVLAVIAGVFTGVFQSVIRTQISETSQNEVTSQLNFAISTMQRFVKGSSVISFDGCGSTSTLSLVMPQDSQSPTVLYAQSGKLYVQQGSAAPQAITDDTVTVDSLEFTKFCNAGAKDTVEISLALSTTGSGTGERISRSLTSAVSRVDAVTFDSTLLPPTDATYDVGLWPTLRWRNGAFSGQVRGGELCIADDCKSSWSQVGSSQWTSASSGIFYTGGNVGVGTSTMPHPLSVDGNIYATGNIGIGTSTIPEKLSVNGNIRILASAGKIIFGDNTEQSTAATGNPPSVPFSASDTPETTTGISWLYPTQWVNVRTFTIPVTGDRIVDSLAFQADVKNTQHDNITVQLKLSPDSSCIRTLGNVQSIYFPTGSTNTYFTFSSIVTDASLLSLGPSGNINVYVCAMKTASGGQMPYFQRRNLYLNTLYLKGSAPKVWNASILPKTPGTSVIKLIQTTSEGVPGCPAGWTDASGQLTTTAGTPYHNYERVCYRTDASCQVMEFEQYTGIAGVPGCPSGWTDAVGQLRYYTVNASENYRRICFICQ